MPNLARIIIATNLLTSTAVFAADAGNRGSMYEAKALLLRAIAHIDEVGKQQAYTDFSRRDGAFIDRDLYVYCFDMKGTAVAHGGNPTLIGMNMLELMDADGVQPVKESIHVAQTTGQGWVDFKWPNPVTKKIEAKSAFISKAKDDWCGVGYYKG